MSTVRLANDGRVVSTGACYCRFFLVKGNKNKKEGALEYKPNEKKTHPVKQPVDYSVTLTTKASTQPIISNSSLIHGHSSSCIWHFPP